MITSHPVPGETYYWAITDPGWSKVWFSLRLTQLPTGRPPGGRVMSVKTVPMPARPAPGGADRVLQAKIMAPSVPGWMVPRPRLQDAYRRRHRRTSHGGHRSAGRRQDDGRRVVGGRQARPRGMDHARPLRQQPEGLLGYRRGGVAERGSHAAARIRGTGPDGRLRPRVPAPARVGAGRAGPAGGAGPRRSSPGGGPWADGRPAVPAAEREARAAARDLLADRPAAAVAPLPARRGADRDPRLRTSLQRSRSRLADGTAWHHAAAQDARTPDRAGRGLGRGTAPGCDLARRPPRPRAIHQGTRRREQRRRWLPDRGGAQQPASRDPGPAAENQHPGPGQLRRRQ